MGNVSFQRKDEDQGTTDAGERDRLANSVYQ